MNKKGQALVEYILIIALVSVLAIALVNYFGGYLKDSITKYGKRSKINCYERCKTFRRKSRFLFKKSI